MFHLLFHERSPRFSQNVGTSSQARTNAAAAVHLSALQRVPLSGLAAATNKTPYRSPARTKAKACVRCASINATSERTTQTNRV